MLSFAKPLALPVPTSAIRYLRARCVRFLFLSSNVDMKKKADLRSLKQEDTKAVSKISTEANQKPHFCANL